MPFTRKKSTELAEDIIWGIDGPHGIAAELNIPLSQARRLIRLKQLPVRRLGHRTYTASKTELRRWFAGRTNNPSESA